MKKTLNTKKTTKIHIFKGKDLNGKDDIYFRNHEIAEVLSIKQPFEFSKRIENKYPLGVVRGDLSASFRKDKIDNGRTVFLSGTCLLNYLKHEIYNCGLKYDKSKCASLINDIASIL